MVGLLVLTSKPIRHLPTAEIIPGELGPTSRDLDCDFSMEWTLSC